VKAVFADTFYWVALTHPAEARDQQALTRENDRRSAVVFTPVNIRGFTTSLNERFP
jgi:hypothetical protein